MADGHHLGFKSAWFQLPVGFRAALCVINLLQNFVGYLEQLQRYNDFWNSTWYPFAILDFLESSFLSNVLFRMTACISVPNLVQISRTIAEILRFIDFQIVAVAILDLF